MQPLLPDSVTSFTPQILQGAKRPGAGASGHKQTLGTDIFMPALEPSLSIGKQASQTTKDAIWTTGKRLKISSSIGELPNLRKAVQKPAEQPSIQKEPRG